MLSLRLDDGRHGSWCRQSSFTTASRCSHSRHISLSASGALAPAFRPQAFFGARIRWQQRRNGERMRLLVLPIKASGGSLPNPAGQRVSGRSAPYRGKEPEAAVTALSPIAAPRSARLYWVSMRGSPRCRRQELRAPAQSVLASHDGAPVKWTRSGIGGAIRGLLRRAGADGMWRPVRGRAARRGSSAMPSTTSPPNKKCPELAISI